MKMYKLYPEISAAGGLINALNNAFIGTGSALRVVTDDKFDKLPFTYARVEKCNRFSQVYIAAEEKLYLPDYWRDGVCLGNGATDNITSLVQSINFWLCTDRNSTELADNFPFVTLTAKAKAFDEGKEVQYAWNSILTDPHMSELKPFVEVAMKDEVLSTLFPFTSLVRLCFSRCTGYPYTNDTPMVIPAPDHSYEVRLSNNDVVGRGSTSEALRMVKDNLPKDIKPAVKGTAEDLQNST